MSRFEFKPESELPRSVQLGQVARLVYGHLGECARSRGVAMLAREIAKNVIDHAGGQGFVEVASVDGGATFVVRDFGPGFSFEEMRADGASTRAGNGTNYGIGLSMIEDMAESLQVRIVREHLDDGVRYTVTVPLSAI